MPLLVVGVLLPGTYEIELPQVLAGLVPTPRSLSNVAVRYLRVDDAETADRIRLRQLVGLGFTGFARAGAARGLQSTSALVADDLVIEGGVPQDAPPCIAFYVAGEQSPVAIFPLHPRLWLDQVATRALRNLIRTDLGSSRILEVCRGLAVGPGSNAIREAVQRHINFVRRRLLLAPPAAEATAVTRAAQVPAARNRGFRRGWEPLAALAAEFKVPRSSAQLLMNDNLDDNEHTKFKGRVYVLRTAFERALKERRWR